VGRQVSWDIFTGQWTAVYPLGARGRNGDSTGTEQIYKEIKVKYTIAWQVPPKKTVSRSCDSWSVI
jgi:hypothetical protein